MASSSISPSEFSSPLAKKIKHLYFSSDLPAVTELVEGDLILDFLHAHCSVLLPFA